MITSKPATNAGQTFADAFGGANIASTTLKALQAFGQIWRINQEAKRYLSYVFQNYWVALAQIQQLLTAHHINSSQAADMVASWNDARDSAIIGYQDIKKATADQAINVAMQAFVSIVGTALNSALKAAL